jgi:hypothetical protein
MVGAGILVEHSHCFVENVRLRASDRASTHKRMTRKADAGDLHPDKVLAPDLRTGLGIMDRLTPVHLVDRVRRLQYCLSSHRPPRGIEPVDSGRSDLVRSPFWANRKSVTDPKKAFSDSPDYSLGPISTSSKLGQNRQHRLIQAQQRMSRHKSGGKQ